MSGSGVARGLKPSLSLPAVCWSASRTWFVARVLPVEVSLISWSGLSWICFDFSLIGEDSQNSIAWDISEV